MKSSSTFHFNSTGNSSVLSILSKDTTPLYDRLRVAARISTQYALLLIAAFATSWFMLNRDARLKTSYGALSSMARDASEVMMMFLPFVTLTSEVTLEIKLRLASESNFKTCYFCSKSRVNGIGMNWLKTS